MGIQQPSYIDIGAADPKVLNNTYLFYKNGCSGVLAEPNPYFIQLIKKHRPRDRVFHGGIGAENGGEKNFYVLSNPFLSTFDKDTVDSITSNSDITVIREINVPIIGINEVISRFCNQTPNIFSLDVEGQDLDILKSFNFDAYAPEIFCVESISHPYIQDNTHNVNDIFDIMNENGYMVFADTFINTIFVHREKWENRN